MKKGRDGDSYLVEVPPSQLEKVRSASVGGDTINCVVHPPEGQKRNLRDVQPKAIVQTRDDLVISDIGFCQHRRYDNAIIPRSWLPAG
jgi:hypothetical protein